MFSATWNKCYVNNGCTKLLGWSLENWILCWADTPKDICLKYIFKLMARLLGCFVENWMQICRAGAPINLSQHSFCRWLPQHKINCSYIHLPDFQAFCIDSRRGEYFKWYLSQLLNVIKFKSLFYTMPLNEWENQVGLHWLSCWCMQRLDLHWVQIGYN